MTRFNSLIVMALAWMLATTVLNPSAAPAAMRGPETRSSSSMLASESWIGAAAALACGLSVKLTILTGGAVVATIAAAVASCSLMIFDGMLEK